MTEETKVRKGGCGNKLVVGARVVYRCYDHTVIGYVHSFTPKKVRLSTKPGLSNVYHTQFDGMVYCIGRSDLEEENKQLKEYITNSLTDAIKSVKDADLSKSE